MNRVQLRTAVTTITGITDDTIIDQSITMAVYELSRRVPRRGVFSQKIETSKSREGTGFAVDTVITLEGPILFGLCIRDQSHSDGGCNAVP